MPDFKNIVRQRVGPLRLNAAAETNLIDELTQHLEDRYQELASGGASEDEAYRASIAELDDMHPLRAAIPDHDRMPARDPVPAGDAPRGNFMEGLGRDLRYTLRSMRKNPLFVLSAVFTLALGIGANTTVFTVINTLILNPLPVPQSSQLAAIAEAKGAAKAGPALPVSFLNLKDYQSLNSTFRSVAGYSGPRVLTWQADGGSQRIFGELVTGNYFSTLDLTPVRGRFFSPEEDTTPGGHPIAVMNYATWQSRFGGAENIAGKTLRLNNVEFTIIGVAPPQFIGVNAIFGPDLWIPAAMAERLLPAEMRGALSDRAKAVFQGAGRLKPGIARAQAQANFTTIAATLASQYPAANEGRTATVRPITDVIFGNSNSTQRAPILLGSIVLLAVVVIILLIACSNVANLLMARSSARQQEIAIRLALGASRARLVRQLLTESVLLGLLSGVAGVALGLVGTRLLWSFRPAEVAANMISPKLDAPVFIFAFIISLITGFVFGTVPALRASRTSVAETLKEESRTTGRSRRRITFANALLAGQVAFSFLSLVTAALFLRSIEHAYQIDPGFQTKKLAIFMTTPGQAGYGVPQTKAFYKEVRHRAAELPGVQSVSWASNLPLFGRVANGLQIEGRAQRSKADTIATVVNTVDLNFFDTTGIPLLNGRAFSEMDQESSLPVAIVNQKLAHDYWPSGEALGKRLQLPSEKIMRQVVGVVKNANYSTLGEPSQPCVYIPLEQNFSDAMTLYVRTQGDPSQVLIPVQRELRAAAPRMSADDARTGGKIVDQALFAARIGVALLAVFGLLALGLASVGLYGIMAYSVNLRKREIGVRMALGAAQGAVVRLIMKQGLSLVLIGLGIGFAAALAAGRLLSRMLFGVSATDPLSVAAAAIALFAVASLACYLPARWASRADPLEALREG